MKLPYKISRTLKRYDSNHGRQVMIRIRTRSKKDFEIPVYDTIDGVKFPISIKMENWYNGYAIGGDYHIPLKNLNQLIDSIENKVKYAVFILLQRKIELTRRKILHLTYSGPKFLKKDPERNETDELITKYHEGAFESAEEFLNFISNAADAKYKDLKRELGLYEKNYLLDYWNDFIRDYAPSSYSNSKGAIQKYIEETGDNCIVTRFDDNWLYRYFKYLLKYGYKRENYENPKLQYKASTLSKYLKHMRSFGDYLFEQKIITNQNYKRYKLGK
ncbi:MAG: phage integrase SAM-like domain-containing protein [Bacteroidales bacterium]|nr:phage integrase SAM-like domain-containing protein [Bacteroidales bacterium]